MRNWETFVFSITHQGTDLHTQDVSSQSACYKCLNCQDRSCLCNQQVWPGTSITWHPFPSPVSLSLAKQYRKATTEIYKTLNFQAQWSSINVSVKSNDSLFGEKKVVALSFTSASVFCCQATFSSSDVLFGFFFPSPQIQWCEAVSKFTEQLWRPWCICDYFTVLFHWLLPSPAYLFPLKWHSTFCMFVFCMFVDLPILMHIQFLFLPLHELFLIPYQGAFCACC